jgi:hypothetical protein
MATQADKFLAKQELEKRRIKQAELYKKNFEIMTDEELEQIINEPIEAEATH